MSLWVGVLALSGAAMANTSMTSYRPQARSLEDRADDARRECLSPGSVLPKITFKPPSGAWAEHLKTSWPKMIAEVFHKPVILHFAGYIQAALDGRNPLHVDEVLDQLGEETWTVAHERGLDGFEATCLAGCVVNHLMKGDEDAPPFASIDFAVNDGIGDCKHFAAVTKRMLGDVGIWAYYMVSYDHAFNWVKVNGSWYLYDPTWGVANNCNFVKVD